MAEKRSEAEESNLAIIGQLYKLRRDGLIDEASRLPTDDIDWRYNAATSVLKFAGMHQGRETVVEYFRLLGQAFTLERYDILEMIAQNDRGFALADIAFRNNVPQQRNGQTPRIAQG